MGSYATGRVAPLFSGGHMRAAARFGSALAGLGTPPAASADYVSAVTDLVGKDWGMMSNDTIGSCFFADSAHTLMLRTANTGTWKMPAAQDVVTAYSVATGYQPGNDTTDNGTMEGAGCEFMRTTGLLSHRSSAYAPIAAGHIDEAALDRIRWTVQLFGSARLGVLLPDNAQDQFDAGLPWTVVGDLPPGDGHDVPVVGYDGEWFQVVSWGGLQRVSAEWLLKYGEEGWAELYPDFLMSTGLTPAGFDMVTLSADLRALQA